MSIKGGFEGTLWTSSTKAGPATNVGIVTRFGPTVEPGNLEVPGTGRRGLYDILLGMVEPKVSIDFQPTSVSFLSTYQDGQTAIPFLHLRLSATVGITWTSAYINTLSLETRAGGIPSATMELWCLLGEALSMGSLGSEVTTPYRWLDTILRIATVVETEWHLWRYEVNNHLQRLSNVSSRASREIDARNRTVTGLIQKDLRDFTEYTAMMTVGSTPAKFNITITVFGTELLNSSCRWGPLDAPAGPEDLILKRFPFTALDLT